MRKPSTAEMWSHQQHPPSNKKAILQCISTMLDIRGRLKQAGDPEMYRHVSMILFDYIMLMYIDAKSKEVLDQKLAEELRRKGKTFEPDRQGQSYWEDIRAHGIGFEKLFQSLAETLAEDPLSGLVTV